jgi:PAS domain S-box-containing protein
MASTQAATVRQSGRRLLLPALLMRRGPGHPRAGVLALAVALFAAVLGFRIALPDANDPVLIWTVVPVALLALEAGTRGGVVGATVAVASLGVWSLIDDAQLSLIGYLARVSTFFLVGVLVGNLADHLSRARAAQRMLLDLAPKSALALDLDGRVTLANSAAEDLFGYRGDEFAGLPVGELVPDFFEALERVVRMRTTSGTTLLLTGVSKDGREFRVRATVDALASDTGALLVSFHHTHVWPEIVGPWRGGRL